MNDTLSIGIGLVLLVGNFILLCFMIVFRKQINEDDIKHEAQRDFKRSYKLDQEAEIYSKEMFRLQQEAKNAHNSTR